MSTIICPRCGAIVPRRMNFKPFCSRCGWNLQRAELKVAGQTSAAKFVPIAIAVFAMFAMFAAVAQPKARTGFIFVPIIFLSVLAIPIWSYFSTRNAVAEAKSTANPALALSQPPLDPALQRLQVMPRPRRVKFRLPSALIVIVIFAALLGFGATVFTANATANAHHRGNASPFLVLPVFFVILVLVPYFRDKKKLALMRDGEIALAKVTYQENMSAGKSSYSRIGYEFKTNSGQLIQDQAKDLTWTVYEDMTIPVFYDPQNPSNNVTPCSTYLKIATNPY